MVTFLSKKYINLSENIVIFLLFESNNERNGGNGCMNNDSAIEKVIDGNVDER